MILFELNDQYIAVGGLIDGRTKGLNSPTYVTDATGTANVYDPSGALVAGPLAFAFYSGTLVLNNKTCPGGNYLASLAGSGFDPTPGNLYTVKIDLVSALFGTAHWEIETTVAVRQQ